MTPAKSAQHLIVAVVDHVMRTNRWKRVALNKILMLEHKKKRYFRRQNASFELNTFRWQQQLLHVGNLSPDTTFEHPRANVLFDFADSVLELFADCLSAKRVDIE